MKKFSILISSLALAMLLNLHAEKAFSQQKESIKWYTIEEVQQLSKKNPRKVFIDMYTDWCGWCKKMDATTFQDPGIIKILNTNFYAVKFDAEGKDEVVFKNQAYKFVPQGKRGYHELAAAMMNGKLSYPTTVYLDEKLNLIQPIPGYMTVDKLEPILIFLGENHYKNQTWQDFSKSYSSN